MIPKRVEVIIVSQGETKESQEITVNCVNSLLKSDPDIYFDVTIVETNREISYRGVKHVITTPQGIKFNYHKFLNYGVKASLDEYICLCSSGITFERGWASEMIKQMEANPELMSASPFCAETQSEALKTAALIYGYEIDCQLNSWCIFQQKKIYEKIVKLNEDIGDTPPAILYVNQLKSANIKHALCTNSIVHYSN